MTVEVPDEKEDIIVKDNYGVVRFCIHGWRTMGVGGLLLSEYDLS